MVRTAVLAAGGIVLRRAETPLVAVVRLRKRNEWVLPKGKLDNGETPRAAAEREVNEETGHDVAVHGPERREHAACRSLRAPPVLLLGQQLEPDPGLGRKPDVVAADFCRTAVVTRDRNVQFVMVVSTGRRNTLS